MDEPFMPMLPSQESHLRSILVEAEQRIDAKYREGAKEHKSVLSDAREEHLLEMAIEEAIDQVVYLITLKQKFRARDQRIRTGAV